jgi:hypothetical protein
MKPFTMYETRRGKLLRSPVSTQPYFHTCRTHWIPPLHGLFCVGRAIPCARRHIKCLEITEVYIGLSCHTRRNAVYITAFQNGRELGKHLIKQPKKEIFRIKGTWLISLPYTRKEHEIIGQILQLSV